MAESSGSWVLLSYRMPREPSSPRIAVWRKLKRAGVAQLGDGLVALPHDARTREQIDWIAEEVVEGGGEAMVWLARPASRAQERELAVRMRDARAAEYQRILAETGIGDVSDEERKRLVRKLRGQLRQVYRRDFFPPPERDRARLAVEDLAAVADVTDPVVGEECAS